MTVLGLLGRRSELLRTLRNEKIDILGDNGVTHSSLNDQVN